MPARSDGPSDNPFGEQEDVPAPTKPSLPAALPPSAAQTLQRTRNILARTATRSRP